MVDTEDTTGYLERGEFEQVRRQVSGMIQAGDFVQVSELRQKYAEAGDASRLEAVDAGIEDGRLVAQGEARFLVLAGCVSVVLAPVAYFSVLHLLGSPATSFAPLSPAGSVAAVFVIAALGAFGRAVFAARSVSQLDGENALAHEATRA